MSKYAVLKIAGRQYRVSEGDEILVDKLHSDKPEIDVLLLCDGEKINIGKPTLKEAKVTLKVLALEEKGEKLDVYKYKAKSRYRRHIGFRPKYSKVKIEKIEI